MGLAERALDGAPLGATELVDLLDAREPLLPLLHEAHRVRQHFFGNLVRVHVLNNAQNARCSEDCGYCSQSSVSRALLKPYGWKPKQMLLEEARAAYAAGAFRYCMVASGRGLSRHRVRELANVVSAIKREVPVEICVSVGLLDEDNARKLKEAGVDRLNHNLNTSASHYPKVCTTHTYADRVATIEAAHAVGLATCSGMIVGMGESDLDIVEVALELRRLEVPSIPLNFLIPIEGNSVYSDSSITPERALRVLALFRLSNPSAEIRAAAGREGHLRSLEVLALYPANSVFVEGYLTTRGGSAHATFRMIRDAGFVVERADGSIATWEELGLDERYCVNGSKDIMKSELLAETR